MCFAFGARARLDAAEQVQPDYTGKRANAQMAIEIMNAWSGTLTAILFDQPRTDAEWSPPNLQLFANGQHQSAWAGQIIVRAAELIRHTFSAEAAEKAFNVSRFESMLRNVYLPHTQVGGAARGNWNGWGVNVVYSLANATIGMGVFLDDRAVFDAGLNDLRGQVPSAIYLVGDDTSAYPNLAGRSAQCAAGDGLRQANGHREHDPWSVVEPKSVHQRVAGRDLPRREPHGHGLRGHAYAADTARIQGVDLYGQFETRFLTSLELNASYINPFLDRKPAPENWACAAALNEGGSAYKLRWELAYNHYAQRGGKSLPQVEALVARFRPTGTGLHINWEPLTHAGSP